MKNKIPKKAITDKQLRKVLKAAADKEGSLSSWAVVNRITPQAVSAFMRRVQGAGLQIPEALGYKPAVIFIPIANKKPKLTTARQIRDMKIMQARMKSANKKKKNY
jgi:hypothetical protein